MQPYADDFYVIVKFILCLGDANHISSFHAFMRPVEITAPTPRGDFLLCPVTPELITLTTIVEIRVGDTHPVVIALAHDSITENDDLLTALKNTPEWQETQPVCDIRGQAVGVFLDEQLVDPMIVEHWDMIDEHEIHLLISLGLIGNVPMVTVPGVNLKKPLQDNHNPTNNQTDSTNPTLPSIPEHNVSVVDLGDWKANNKEN